MPNPYQRVRPGQRAAFTVTSHNALMEVAEAHRRRGPSLGIAGDLSGFRRDADVVFVKNTTDQDMELGQAVGLSLSDGTAAKPNLVQLGRWIWDATLPAAADVGRFAVLVRACAAGKIAPAIISGVSPAQLTITTEADTRADIDPGSPRLKTGPWGLAQILWKEAGTGEKWGIVRLSAAPPKQLVWLTENLLPGGTAEARAVTWSPTGGDGSGGFVADPEPTEPLEDDPGLFAVHDVRAQHWGLRGEWIEVERVSGRDAEILMPVSSGAASHLVTLDEEMQYGTECPCTAIVRDTYEVTVNVWPQWVLTGQTVAAESEMAIKMLVWEKKWVPAQIGCL